MMKQDQARKLRVIVSGGGTGGHIFPAIAIADELARMRPDTEFLFVGAEGKMEMEKVPKAGYKIVGLPIRGLERRLSWANLSFPFRLISSLWTSRQLIKSFRPDVVIGTGGYAGGPILYAAAKMGIPTLIQEPNAFAGLANKWVGRYVDVICVAFENMRRYFPQGEIVITGNPVREGLLDTVADYRSSKADDRKDVLLMGGSGGARSLNEALAANTDLIESQPNIHWTWQCGKFYYEQFKDSATAQLPNVTISAFLDQMDQAYAKADIVIGRAGSTTIAEIEYLGKPTILVPSPWVAEDHQTMNAKALVENDAAVLVTDKTTKAELVPTVFGLLSDPERLAQIGANAKAQAKPGAVTRITNEVLRLIGEKIPEPAVPLPKQSVYFIGIGGIGMSALARYYNSRGWKVSGYDRSKTALTDAMESEGIVIHFEPQAEEVPTADLYVYTPAMPDDFPELVAIRAMGKQLYKRSEVLGMISKAQDCVAIAGTHGKTTTTTLTTWLMQQCGVNTSAFLGGIPRNFAGNYVHGTDNWVTVEADEYDRSFLRLFPKLAVILSMDADHLDIYGDHESMLETGFLAFGRQIDADGCLVVRHDLKDHFVGQVDCEVRTFGIEQGDYRAERISVQNGMFTFDFQGPDGIVLKGLQIPLPGRHNVENATAAMAMTLLAGGDANQLNMALAEFEGIGRRFEFISRQDELVIVDDYAHHPTELTAAISAARELYPAAKITGVFQPHLYSRTRDFADGFAKALDLLDRAILLPIYPARELPMEGVSSQMLLDRMQLDNKTIVSKENLSELLLAERPEVLLMLGAGDIDALVRPVNESLTKNIAL